VCGAGYGQNPARQIAVHSGIPAHIPAYTVNKVCGSGMKAVTLAALMINSGEAEIVLAGGAENMSQIPYASMDARWGGRMGNKELVDLMIRDGLSDIFNDYHMGVTAENLASQYQISREEQDAFAAASQNKTEAAMKSGRFSEEIVPVVIPQRKGDPIVIDKDEMPRAGVTAESLAKLRPAFKSDGSVTAANSSGINDGAALLLLMSEEKALEKELDAPLRELMASNSVKITFIDIPIHRQTTLYNRYFLYAANAAGSGRDLLLARQELFALAGRDAAANEKKIVSLFKNRNIAFKVYDLKTVYPEFNRIIKQFNVSSTPTCVVKYSPTDVRTYSGISRIRNGLAVLRAATAKLK